MSQRGHQSSPGPTSPPDGSQSQAARPASRELGDRPASPLLAGAYRLEAEIGRGAMCAVFRACHAPSGQLVAVKVLLPHHQVHPPSVAGFEAEAQALSAVRHRGVVRLHDRGQTEGTPFMALEYIAGRSLAEHLHEARAQQRWLALPFVVSVLDQLAAALAAVHAAGLAHRDVKPGNVMIEDQTLRPVLTDFGLSRVQGPDAPPPGTPRGGTPGYMAPEVLHGDALTVAEEARGDVYAFGVTAFELLTGSRPFEAEHWAELLKRQLTQTPVAPAALRPLPAHLNQLILQCLAPDPLQRFPGGAALQLALQPMLPLATETQGPPGGTPSFRGSVPTIPAVGPHRK